MVGILPRRFMTCSVAEYGKLTRNDFPVEFTESALPDRNRHGEMAE